MTNAEKFKEVFGFDYDKNVPLECETDCCEECRYYIGWDCERDIMWWQEEYKEKSNVN